MQAKAVERDHKATNMEDILKKDTLAIQRNDSVATTQNQKVQVVPHPDLKLCNCLVRDKSGLVQDHVISSIRISKRKTAAGARVN